MSELSPMMLQYKEIKDNHKDKILFFRLGDFYEMFFDDAIIASKALDLTLTGRDCGQAERAPMCGVPYHSASAYIQRLIEQGFKVAICEQTENPKQASGLVKRDVVRIITKGTVLENAMLDDEKNNYLASVYIKNEQVGISFTDISCGTIKATQNIDQEVSDFIISELSRFLPAEIIFNSELLKHKKVMDYIKKDLSCCVEIIDDYVYLQKNVQETIKKHLKDEVIKQSEYLAACVAATLHYLEITQKKVLQSLNTIGNYDSKEFVNIPKETRNNLELIETMRTREKKGSLLYVLDSTKTSMGKRLLRQFIEQPILSIVEIQRRQNAVKALFNDSITRTLLRDILSKIFDIERLCSRIVFASALPKELIALKNCIEKFPEIKALIQGYDEFIFVKISKELDSLVDVKNIIATTLNENVDENDKTSHIINKGYSKELDTYKNLVYDSKTMLSALEQRLREQSGIKTLKIGYNRVFGYYIEVTKSFISDVPEHFIRKQTLAGAERYVTQELKELEEKILNASEKIDILEAQIFSELLQKLSIDIKRIQTTARAIAELDLYSNFAEIAAQNNYCCPILSGGDAIIIKQGRHPVVEQLSAQAFIPNDITMDCSQNRMLIITGPNMAGKSTYMRQTALIALMAQIGSFVPATECRMGIISGIYTRVGASDDLAAGQSTFMVEMSELSYILKSADQKSLIILDEIGRGTSTFDGMSIARAVIEHVVNKKVLGAKTLFATHYHELTDMAGSYDGIKNYSVAVKKRGDDITFLRKIVNGAADDSYGIQVAKLAGVEDSIIERAKEILIDLEKHSYLLSGKPIQIGFDDELEENAETVHKKELYIDKLKELSLETLSPLEAWQLLSEMQKEIYSI